MFGRKKKQPLSKYDAFWALRRLMLESKPHLASWDPSYTGMVQQEMVDLLRKLQAEGSEIGQALTEADISGLWDDGLPPSDGGGLQGHDRYDKEEGSVRLGLSDELDNPNSGGAGFLHNPEDK